VDKRTLKSRGEVKTEKCVQLRYPIRKLRSIVYSQTSVKGPLAQQEEEEEEEEEESSAPIGSRY
jgi:hypothetical protein